MTGQVGATLLILSIAFALVGGGAVGVAVAVVLAFPAWGLVSVAIARIKFAGLEGRIAGVELSTLDRMTGEEFEDALARMFAAQGYHVVQTPVTGDFGADLLLRRGADRAVVQAKRYAGSVGQEAVREAHAAKAIYGADRAVVVTTGRFTSHAMQLARANSVEIWDRDTLGNALAALYELQAPRATLATVLGERLAARVRR